LISARKVSLNFREWVQRQVMIARTELKYLANPTSKELEAFQLFRDQTDSEYVGQDYRRGWSKGIRFGRRANLPQLPPRLLRRLPTSGSRLNRSKRHCQLRHHPCSWDYRNFQILGFASQ